MVDLPTVPIREDIVSKPPQPGVSPQQIASPYNLLANAMDKTSEALDKIGETAGERAGYEAARNATIGADGAVHIDKAPLFGKAMDSYSRAVKVGALAEAEGAIRREEIKTREKYRDDPDGYADYITEFGKKMEKQYSDAAGGDVGAAVRKTIEDTGTRVYRGLQNEKEALTLQRTNKDIAAQITSHTDDLLALVRGGATGKEVTDHFDAIKQLQVERTQNPRLAYPESQAKYEMDHLAGEVGANRFLYETDQVYKNPDPNIGGAKNALAHAETVLTDPRFKLTEAERYKFYSRAKNEVHVNEAIRKGDLQELRNSANEFIQNVTVMGGRADPQVAEQIMKAGDEAGAPSIRLHMQAALMRHSLNDGWDRQSLGKQAADIEAGSSDTTIRGTANVPPALLQHVKKWESFAPVAKFDFKGYSVGYGSPGEKGQTTTEPEAAAVVAQRLSNARRSVEQFAPNAPAGVKDALTSLTNNAGTTWQTSGLGKAVQAGDYSEAKTRFLQYINAKDERTGIVHTPKGLVDRRREEAEWFNPGSPGATGTGVTPTETTQGVDPDHPQAIPGGISKGRMASRTEASPDWLAENRRGIVSQEARKQWDARYKDWDEKEVFPNPEAIKEIAYAAQVVGDHDLSVKMARDLDLMQQVRDIRAMPLPAQESKITELKAKASIGGYDEVGRAALLKHASSTMNNIETGLKTDAPGTAAIMMPEKLNIPAPLDINDPAKMAAGMKLREQNVRVAEQTWQTGPYSALGKQDLEAVQTHLEQTQDPKVKAQIFAGIATGISDPKIRSTTMAAIGGKSVDLSAEAYAGGLNAQDPKIAASIFNGAAKLKADPRLMPSKSTELGKIKIGDWNTEMDERMPASIFSETDRANPTGKYNTFKKAVEYRYADLADLDSHDISGDLKNDRLQRAINDVSGGILEHGGWKLVAPERGMSQEKFDAKLWGFNEDDLKGVTTQNGRPITVDELRRQAHLESQSEGKYLVLMGTSTDYGSDKPSKQPVYVYKDGKPFTLDFHNRPDFKRPDPKIDLMPQPFGDFSTLKDIGGDQGEPVTIAEGGLGEMMLRDTSVPLSTNVEQRGRNLEHGLRHAMPDFARERENMGRVVPNEGLAKEAGIGDIPEPKKDELDLELEEMFKRGTPGDMAKVHSFVRQLNGK